MASDKNYDGTINNENADYEAVNDWESLMDDDSEFISAFATHALQKSQARRRAEQGKNHSKLDTPYNKRRKRIEQDLGHIGTSILDARDRTTDQQAIRQELQDYGVDSVDELDGMERSYVQTLSPEQVFDKFNKLFSFLGEDTEGNPSVIEEYQQITDRKEQLRFILTSSLSDKVRLFCSDVFGYSNYDNFMHRLQFQQDFINGTAKVWRQEWDYHKGEYVDVQKTLDPSEADKRDILIGLNRASLKSAMIGTPEYGAYKMALDIANSNDKQISPDFPEVSGFESGVDFEHIGCWKPLIEEYNMIAEKMAKKNPGMDKEELEHITVRKAAHLFADSMDYNDPRRTGGSSYVSSFHESIVWAQLGPLVKAQLRGMRRNFDGVNLCNIERFIGKSGYSEKRRSLEAERLRLGNRIEYINELSDDGKQEFLAKENAFEMKKQEEWREKEIARINHKYENLISKTRSEERKTIYANRQEEEKQRVMADTSQQIEYFKDRSIDDLLSDINERRELLAHRIEKRKSLAEKAIELHFAIGRDRKEWDSDLEEYVVTRSGSQYQECLDWINEAPFGVIKRAHKRMTEGMSGDEIYKLAMCEIIGKVVNQPDQSEKTMDQLFRNAEKSFEEMDVLRELMRCSLSNFKTDIELRNTILSKTPGKVEQFATYAKLHRRMNNEGIINGIENGQLNLEVLEEYPWLMNQYSTPRGNADAFPANKSDSAKYKWCSDNSFVWLDGDWGRQTLGKIIYTRLQSGVEKSVHDATQWLSSFQIPERAYNIPEIKKQVEQGERVNIEDYALTMYDKDLERTYLARILGAPQSIRNRLNLSTKPQNMSKLFSSPEHIFIYSELARIVKDSEIKLEDFEGSIREKVANYYEDNIATPSGKNSEWRMDFYVFEQKVAKTLQNIMQIVQSNEGQTPTGRIGDIMQKLNQYGLNRKIYIEDTTSWLVRHTVSPQQTLTKAWSDRALAIADGVKDSASEINKWASTQLLIEKEKDFLARNNIHEKDMMTTYRPFVDELMRCYGTKTTARAIVNYKRIHNPNKILPAASIPLEVGGRKFTGEVLAHDDPRGMTIGPDTGCCMTVNGASSSCIDSGYRDPGAGFFAFYDINNRLNAQSYFFTHPDYPEVVVMDNIEANSGRDSNRIIGVYQEFFRQYLKDRFANDPNWKIRQVNVGTRYGDVAKAQVKMLKSTEIVPNKLSDYSDARTDQRIIIRLSDAEIAEARNGGPVVELDEVVEPDHSPIPLASPLGINQLLILQSVESQLYPDNMLKYKNEDFAYKELTMPEVDKYSFLVKVQEDATSEADGYCLAYESDSEADPNYPEKVVYVADFGIVPGARGGMTALKAFDELLHRVDENGMKKVEMDVRDSVAYGILNSSWGRRYLASRGFDLVVHENSESFGENETTHLLSLEKRSE